MYINIADRLSKPRNRGSTAITSDSPSNYSVLSMKVPDATIGEEELISGWRDLNISRMQL